MNLKIFSKETEISLLLSGDTTLKEMKNKLISKLEVSEDDFDQSFSLVYKDKQINLNSNEEISHKFNKGDIINLIGSKNDTSISSDFNSQLKEKIIKRQRRNRNKVSKKENLIDSTLEDMAALGCIEKQAIENEKRKGLNKYKSIDECIKSNDDQFFILGILATYLEKIGISTVIEKDDVTKDEKKQSYANTILQFVSNGYILKNKYILDFSLSPNRIKQLYDIDNNDEKNKFDDNLKKVLAKGYNIKENEIVIGNFKKKQNLYTSIIIFKSNFNKVLTKNDLLIMFKKQIELKRLNNVEKDLIIETIRLNKSMLDSKGDNKDDSNWGFNETRGGKPYYPPEGWWRYGLRVYDQYDEKNNDWLSYDNRKGEWCIGYSGLSGITKKNEQIYENDINEDTKEKIGVGVYTSNNSKIMEENTEIVKINSVNYKLGLMLRIKPDKIRCPKSNKDIWIVNGTPDEIRPYGILLKTIKP